MMGWKAILGLWTFLAVATGGLAASAAPDATLDAISEAYVPYRIAVSYLRAGETELGEISLQQFVDRWERLAATLTAEPPAPFDADPKFAASFEEILKAAKNAQVQLAGGNAGKALAELEPVRALLAEVRRRNGIRTLSDCIDDISNQMDLLQNLRDRSFDINDPGKASKASAAIAALAPILDRCARQPPPKNREQFDRLIQQASSSVETARDALTVRDADRFIRVVRELRSIDHILFQQFD